jgi:DNA-dependent RNA polymerase auxiliary subunit epsilon
MVNSIPGEAQHPARQWVVERTFNFHVEFVTRMTVTPCAENTSRS